MLGEWQLYENAMDVLIGIVILYNLSKDITE